jgi:hypothetical protein
VADRIPEPNLRRLRVDLDVEGKSLWLAASGHHLVHRPSQAPALLLPFLLDT